MPTILQHSLEVLLQEETGVIGADGNAHGAPASTTGSVYERIDFDNTIDTTKSSAGNDALGQITSLTHITVGPGLYVCIAGGAIAAIGALFAATRR
ncbi:MAG: hypothetical protein WD271_02930 [Acidimicrobiia bacterium]